MRVAKRLRPDPDARKAVAKDIVELIEDPSELLTSEKFHRYQVLEARNVLSPVFGWINHIVRDLKNDDPSLHQVIDLHYMLHGRDEPVEKSDAAATLHRVKSAHLALTKIAGSLPPDVEAAFVAARRVLGEPPSTAERYLAKPRKILKDLLALKAWVETHDRGSSDVNWTEVLDEWAGREQSRDADDCRAWAEEISDRFLRVAASTDYMAEAVAALHIDQDDGTEWMRRNLEMARVRAEIRSSNALRRIAVGVTTAASVLGIAYGLDAVQVANFSAVIDNIWQGDDDDCFLEFLDCSTPQPAHAPQSTTTTGP